MTGSVDIGVGIARSLSASRDGMIRLATTAESLGFHSAWVAEHIAMPVHYASRYPFTDDGIAPFDHRVDYAEAMVTLGFLAGITQRLRLGTSVIPIITRDPLSLAKQAATVDIASGGRLELGLGAGWLLEEATLLGKPFDHPAGRLEEMIAIMRRAWSEPEFEHHGRFYDIPLAGVHPQPVQTEVPIWIGGISDRLVKIAASCRGVIVPARSVEQTREMVRDTRARLGPDKGLGVVIFLEGKPDQDVEIAAKLCEAGATLIIVQPPQDVDAAEDLFRYFAQDVRPHLG